MPLPPPGWYDPYEEEEEMPWESPYASPTDIGPPPLPPVGPETLPEVGPSIPPLGPVDPGRPYDPYNVDWEEPPDPMTWQTFVSRVSPESMAQLWNYWNDGIEPTAEARSELLGAGLDWYSLFRRGGPPDSYTKQYYYDLEKMWERAMREIRYSTPRVYVPGLGRDIADTGMGPWYNYRRRY